MRHERERGPYEAIMGSGAAHDKGRGRGGEVLDCFGVRGISLNFFFLERGDVLKASNEYVLLKLTGQ